MVTTAPAATATIRPTAAATTQPAASCTKGLIALTFDDGASSFRPQTLKTLRETKVPATFFELGVRTAANPQFAAFENTEGYLVLSHSYYHPNLTNLSTDAVRKEVVDTESALRSAGVEMKFKGIRPPFLTVNDAVSGVLKSLGYTVFLRSDYDTNDSDAATTSDHIRDAVLNNLRPDTVLLMHDGNIDTPAGAGVEGALPQIIAGVQSAGYCFGTLDSNANIVAANPIVPSTRTIPSVVNPVPYLPLVQSLRGTPPLDPPAPSVTVTPTY